MTELKRFEGLALVRNERFGHACVSLRSHISHYARLPPVPAVIKGEAKEAGADFHIVKPVTPVSLLAGLEKAIRASKANEAA